MLLTLLAFTSVCLTCTMFATRQAMLGFACGIFWAITGAQAYTLSTVPWGDIYFYIFFACVFGMTLFTIFAAFGLREVKDSEEDKGENIDEGKEKETYFGETVDKEETFDAPPRPSSRTISLRKRAADRKTAVKGGTR